MWPRASILKNSLSDGSKSVYIRQEGLSSSQLSKQLKESRGCQDIDPSSHDQQEASFIKLLSWNVHQMTWKKFNFLSQYQICLLQEAQWPMDGSEWPKQNLYQAFVKKRSGNPLTTLVNKRIVCERVEKLETKNSLVVKINLRNLSIFLVNLHLTTSSKIEFKLLTEQFQNMPVVIGTDLNSTIRKQSSLPLYDVITDVITRRGHDGKGKQIDYILLQKNLEGIVTETLPFWEWSDHRPLMVKLPIQQKNLFMIPTFKVDQIHVRLNENPVATIYEYLDLCNNPRELGISYIKYNYVRQKTFSEKVEQTKALMFTPRSNEFYKMMKHSKNLKPFKKEGSIMNCLKEDLEIIQDYRVITHKCVRHLVSIQEEVEMEEELEVPQDCRLIFTQEELKQLEGNRKAVSFDLTELSYLTSYITNGILDLDFDRINKYEYLFSMRLVPLNKAHPQVPTIDQFRPIMVQSHFIKLIEAFYVPKFRRICTKEIDPAQIGFVSKMACQYHIGQVIESLKEKFAKKKSVQSKSAIFFDLSNAYNCVDRDRLFKLLRDPEGRYFKYFCNRDLDILEWIYKKMYIYDPIEKKKVYLKNGVHQGSLLAPFLFDIYFNEMIRDLREFQEKKIQELKGVRKLQFGQMRVMAYADDVAIICHFNIMNEISLFFLTQAKKYNFQVNLGKTKYLTRSSKYRINMGEVMKEKAFKYLGIFIDARGNIGRQLKYVRTVINYMAFQLRPLNKMLPLRHMTQLWNTYMRPHFQYVSPILYTQSEVLQGKWEKLRRLSMKLILGLPKSLSAKRIDKIWEKFDFRTPFSNFLKQYQLQIRDGDPYKIFINQQYENFKEVERKRKRIQYFPDKGYFERFKFNWMKCKSCQKGFRWTYEHILHHDSILYNEYEGLDKFIDERMEKEDIKIDTQYQRMLCSKYEMLNVKFRKLVEQNGEFRS